MANPDFYLCDVCGERVEPAERRFIATSRGMDPAGSMEDRGEAVDLCGPCARRYLFYSLQPNPHDTDYEAGQRLIHWIRTRPRQPTK